MSWSDKIFNYCERGSDPSFWAEPANAVTNAAFVIAALVAAVELWRSPVQKRRGAEWALVAIVVVIGIGSFLFHTFATRWSSIADVAPIGVFMLAYFAYALRRFASLHWLWVALALVSFVAALRYAGDIRCRPGLLSVTKSAGGRCLNGTIGYAPAFLAMLAVGSGLAILRHPAWRYLFGAALVFLLSMLARTVDVEICSLTRLGGSLVGTHALWHVFNALTLYILMVAAIRHGRRQV